MKRLSWQYKLRITSIIVTCIIFAASILPAWANSPPGVVDIFVTDTPYSFIDTYNTQAPLTPNAGTTKTIYVNGRVTDPDGVGSGFKDGDLRYVQLIFYRENKGVSCSEDVNNCYRTFCSVQSGDVSSQLEYSCEIETSHLIDPTTTGSQFENEVWQAEIITMDQMEHIASRIKKMEIQSLLAIGFPNSLNFGTLHREQATTSEDNTEYTLTQYGNTEATASISGTDMTCAINGTIPAENIKWSLQDVSYDDPSATSVSDTPTTTGILVSADSEEAENSKLYFNIALPNVVSGNCSGVISIEALQQ